MISNRFCAARRAAVAVLVLAVAAPSMAAGTIYRCGPGGREFSQTPCPGGAEVAAADDRSEAQRAEAQRVAEREQQHAARMARDRRALEASQRPAMATGIDGLRRNAEPAKPAASKPRHKKRGARDKSADEDPSRFEVTAPAPPAKPAAR